MRTAFKLIAALLAALFALSGAANAAEYPQYLRVGIYYGSGSVSSLDLDAAGGFAAGTADGRSLTPVCAVSETTLTARAANAALYGGGAGGAYYLDLGAVGGFDALNARLAEVSAAGVECFGAYYGGAPHIFSGGFKDLNDAQWAAANLSVGASAVQLPPTSVILIGRQSGKARFVSDSGLGVFGTDFRNPDSYIKISGSAMGSYYGGFDIKCGDSGALTVVNVVDCERYLIGVVGREMSPSWHIEALKAQAVCARNFAYLRLNYHGTYGFDVCRTTCCQAYSGIPSDAGNVTDAVSSTCGELMFSGGEPIQAVYSSSMGAKTESVENVWGTPFPYLVSVDNPYEDTENIYNGKWSKTLTAARATEIMKSKGYDVGTVTDISALKYTPAGSVLRLRVSGTGGEKVFEREACRSIFSEATYSQKYTVTRGGTTSYPSVCVTDGTADAQKAINGVSVLSANGIAALSGGAVTATDGNTSKTYSATLSGGDANSFVFSGEGWGHGVGMSQYGAKGMAEAGFSYKDILTHFYTGVTLQKAY